MQASQTHTVFRPSLPTYIPQVGLLLFSLFFPLLTLSATSSGPFLDVGLTSPPAPFPPHPALPFARFRDGQPGHECLGLVLKSPVNRAARETFGCCQPRLRGFCQIARALQGRAMATCPPLKFARGEEGRGGSLGERRLSAHLRGLQSQILSDTLRTPHKTLFDVGLKPPSGSSEARLRGLNPDVDWWVLLGVLKKQRREIHSSFHLYPSSFFPPPFSLRLETPLVRVSLTRLAGAKTLILRAEPGARLTGTDGDTLATGSGPWTITVSDNTAKLCDARGRTLGTGQKDAAWRLLGEDAETRVSVAGSGGTARAYRGGLEVRLTAGKLTVLNEVALETYLRGVVASEMGGSAPLEALKAQAVAARTFALGRLLSRRAPEDYDLRDDTQEQVYKGADVERPICDRAVFETSGQILTLGGKPALTVYCADCGGVTTPGANPGDFPRSVSDADAHGPPDHPRPPAWTQRYTPQALSTLLQKNAALRVSGMLEAIEPIERDSSGRVTRLRLTWKPPVRDVPKESLQDNPPQNGGEPVSREILGTAFRSLLGVNILRSTLFTVTREQTGEFVFTGRGWGHGRGLCQNGAMALAAPPLAQDYKTILNRYYAGAALTRIQYSDPEEAAPEMPK